MSVLNRPMFRQAGGPAEPMPQDMGPETTMLQEAEAGAMSRGQEIGAQYAQDMMQGIDQAQSTEDLINALRGNDKSLEARRSELAGFVGQDDANQTPESVLAMVQPVVMMTEEGMMDSGIGALVQGLVGDVEMTTASGAPTDMGMGVGSLMAAGAQEAPAPQNFRQGGEVAHLQAGSSMTATAPAMSLDPLGFASENVMSFGDTVKGRYEDLLPLYQEILGADQESKDATKAQMLFDIAQGGLQLAAGVPEAGSSFVSQLAGAAAPVAGRIQERGAALEQERRGIKQGALGTAMQQAIAEEDFDRQLKKELLVAQIAAASRRAALGVEERIVLDNRGNEVAILDINEPTDAARYHEYQTDGQYTFRKMGTGEAETLTNYIIQRPTGEEGRLTRELVESFDNGRTYLGQNEDGTSVALAMPTGEGVSVAAISKEEVAALQRSIGSQNKYQRILEQAEREGIAPSTSAITSGSNVNLLISTGAALQDEIAEKTGEPFNLTDTALIQEDLESAKRSAYQAAMEGTGPIAALESGINRFIGFATDLSPGDARREEFRALLRSIRFVGKVALVSNSRFPVAEMALASDLFPNPDQFFADPEVEAQKLQVIMAVTDQLYMENLRELASGGLDQTQRRQAENNMREIQLLRTMLGNVPKPGQEQFTPDRFTGYETRLQETGGQTGIQ